RRRAVLRMSRVAFEGSSLGGGHRPAGTRKDEQSKQGELLHGEYPLPARFGSRLKAVVPRTLCHALPGTRDAEHNAEGADPLRIRVFSSWSSGGRWSWKRRPTDATQPRG